MASVFLDTTDALLTKLVRSRYRKISSLAGLNRQVWSIKELLYGLYRSNFSWEQSRLDTPILSAKVAT